MKTLKLQIVTPEGVAYSDDVEMVIFRSVEGLLGILPSHTRLMTQMLPGEMMVRKNGKDQFLAVGEGLVDVTGEQVAIATDMALEADSINEAKAEEARRRAEARQSSTAPRSGSSWPAPRTAG